jgi:hypothetical protein
MGRIGRPHPLSEDIRGKAIVLQATSGYASLTRKTSVVVYWQPVPEMTGYNLYRRLKGSPSRPVQLNKDAPVRRVATCDELRAIIPEGSREWKMLASAFSGAGVRKTLEIVPHKERQARIVPSSIIAGTGLLREVSPLMPHLVLREASPCEAIERGLDADEEALFEVMANVNLRIRLAAGLAYVDPTVQNGKEYIYELRGVRKDGTEVAWPAEVTIVAGRVVLPGPPAGLAAAGGDRRVLCTWTRNDDAHGWSVQRSISLAGPYQSVTEEPVIYDVNTDVHGIPFDPPASLPGFLDWQRWDDDGLPVTHTVGGVPVKGPKNYVTYHYRVASYDILGRLGPWSDPVSAQPTRSTVPMAPTDFRVTANRSTLGITLTWRKVTRDVAGHQILDATQSYRIHRAETLAELDDPASLAGYLVTIVTADPADPATPTLSWVDTDPGLVAPYGEKDFWYRICCVDAYGLTSDPSPALSGRVPDVRPPGPTQMVGSEGKATSILVYWNPNPEPDLSGYQIYRSVCDLGMPFRPEIQEEKIGSCDFALVGQISVAEAKKRVENTGNIWFEDTSVPDGSPVCYAYWVRAYDLSGNLYQGDSGCPASPDEYVCQRLYEESPPPVPILSALKARNNAVLVEWIASPVQDLRAFHVWRSDKEDGPLDFRGGVLTDGTILTDLYVPVEPTCEDIPAEPDPQTVHGSFLDTKVEPNHVYWYRVSALDWLGHESEGADLTLIPAVSTFTYSTDVPPEPAVLPPGAQPASDCGLEVRWNPAYDPAVHMGFLVYRSSAAAGPFRQVSGIVKDNLFSDGSALRATDFWYQVQAVDLDGRLSKPSPAVKHRY